jgi:5S rRNA maturation endonuclease (ribonuclease M5)
VGLRSAVAALPTPELLTPDAGEVVFLCEGEKDADVLAGIGLRRPLYRGRRRQGVRDTFSTRSRGRRVVILPDNDKAGRDHAEKVAKGLEGGRETARARAARSSIKVTLVIGSSPWHR